MLANRNNAAPDRVPLYEPDGKDHSLSSDPKFKLLIECGIQIINGELISDYNKEQAFLATVTDRLSEFRKITCLKDEWNKQHKYQYLMSTMSKDEYDRRFRSIYLEKLGLHNQVVESTKKSEENTSSHTDEWTGGEPNWDDKRMQVISEYGW